MPLRGSYPMRPRLGHLERTGEPANESNIARLLADLAINQRAGAVGGDPIDLSSTNVRSGIAGLRAFSRQNSSIWRQMRRDSSEAAVSAFLEHSNMRC